MAVLFPSGDNPGLHWKVITEPSVVTMLSWSSIVPFTGSSGTLQLTNECNITCKYIIRNKNLMLKTLTYILTDCRLGIYTMSYALYSIVQWAS